MSSVLTKEDAGHLTLVPKNHLSLDEHIKRLEQARGKVREGFNEFLDALADAYDQLPENTFQNELCSRLDMKKSMLSRWVSIVRSNYIMNNRTNLPSSMSSLYTLTLIEKKYEEWHGEKSQKMLSKMIEDGRINGTLGRSDFELILADINQTIKQDEQLRRQNAILSLSGASLAPNPLCKTLEEHLADKVRFRSFVIIPTDSQISRWSNEGLFPNDIAEDFPLHDLRAPSMRHAVSCLIKVKMKDLDVGMKLLNAWGFSYRDVAVPPVEKSCTVIDDNYVLLRGERGKRKCISTKTLPSFETDDILGFAERISGTPNLLVFQDSNRDGWSILIEND